MQCAGCALAVRLPCARLAFACTVSALSDIGIPAGRRVMGRLPSSAASRCAGRATSRDGETWLILRLPALKCFPSIRMDLRTGCYFLLVLTCIMAGYMFAVSFPR